MFKSCKWVSLARKTAKSRGRPLITVVALQELSLMYTPQDHVSECKYQPQLCANKGCGLLIAKPDLKDHERNKCLFRVVNCKYCEQKLVFNTLEVSSGP